jgi:hypothetical protein
MKEKVPEVIGLLICHSSDKSKDWKLRYFLVPYFLSLYYYNHQGKITKAEMIKSTINCTHLTSSALTAALLQIQ